jgi:hypothetical protein
MLGFTKIALLRCWIVDRWQMTSTVSSFRRSLLSVLHQGPLLQSCNVCNFDTAKTTKNRIKFQGLTISMNEVEWNWMELNGIRGIYVAYSPWKDLDMILNRPPGPRISQNGLDQSTPLTSRPLLAKSTSCLATKSNQDIFPDIYDDIQIRMIINDY